MAERRGVVRRTGGLAVSGVLGVVIVDAARAAVRRGTVREGAVTVTAWGLRGKRGLETGAETARLVGGDIVAEARARTGEQAPAPGTGLGTDGHVH